MTNETNFDFSGAKFEGPVQIGDNNQQIINNHALAIASFDEQLAGKVLIHPQADRVLSLIQQVGHLTLADTSLEAEAKDEVTQSLIHISDELAAPEEQQSSGRVKRFFSRTLETIGHIDSIAGVTLLLGSLLGFPPL